MRRALPPWRLLALLALATGAAPPSPTPEQLKRTCEAGAARSCYDLAGLYEADQFGDGLDHLARLRLAAGYLRRTCALGQHPSCPRADRLEREAAELEQLHAQKPSDEERERRAQTCERFVAQALRKNKNVHFSEVRLACQDVFAAECRKTWGVVAVLSHHEQYSALLDLGCAQEYCPLLQGKPELAACRGSLPANLSPYEGSQALMPLLKRSLIVELGRERGAALGDQLAALWPLVAG